MSQREGSLRIQLQSHLHVLQAISIGVICYIVLGDRHLHPNQNGQVFETLVFWSLDINRQAVLTLFQDVLKDGEGFYETSNSSKSQIAGRKFGHELMLRTSWAIITCVLNTALRLLKQMGVVKPASFGVCNS